MARNKGRRSERQVVKILQAHGWTARRGYQSRGGREEPDIISDLPFRIEVKHVENLNIFAAFSQMEVDNVEKCAILLVFRRNGEKWKAALDFEELLKLVRH